MIGLLPANRTLEEVLQQGLAFHRAGSLSEASVCYSEALKLDPTHGDALHLLGVVARQLGFLPESERLLVKAIASCSTVCAYHQNLGHTYQLLGKVDEAVKAYRRAIALDPVNLKMIQRFAQLAGRDGLAEAIAMYKALLSRTADSPEAFFELGRLEMQRGQRASAIAAYRGAIALKADVFKYHFNLGGALFESGRLAEAASAYRVAIPLDPGEAQGHFALAVVLQEMGEIGAASEGYGKALAIKPDFAHALNNLGALLMDRGELKQGEGFVRRSLELDPKNISALCNLANILVKRGKARPALDVFQIALGLDPQHVTTLCNFGAFLETMGDRDRALQCYETVLKRHPECASARFNLGMCQLASGEFAAGWAGYEARWGMREFRNARPVLTQPQWRGETIRGSRLFLYSEQGLGDTIQFVRYVSMVRPFGAKVVLRVQPALGELIRAAFPEVEVLSTGPESFADFDWQCALMSLPIAFHTDETNIPVSIPYLKADAALAAMWLQRLRGYDSGHGLRVGVVWAGNPKHARDLQRSIPLEQLGRITLLDGAAFYSLQHGEKAAQQVAALPGAWLIDLSEHLENFSVTAAIVANLDLVITVDTSVAHLAGAMGKPVWMLAAHAADWRWRKDRATSDWYPTMRIFRQKTLGDWSEALDEIESELRGVIATRGES